MEKIVILKAVGGEIGSASSLAPKLGPLGLVSFYDKKIVRNDLANKCSPLIVTKEGW